MHTAIYCRIFLHFSSLKKKIESKHRHRLESNTPQERRKQMELILLCQCYCLLESRRRISFLLRSADCIKLFRVSFSTSSGTLSFYLSVLVIIQRMIGLGCGVAHEDNKLANDLFRAQFPLLYRIKLLFCFVEIKTVFFYNFKIILLF